MRLIALIPLVMLTGCAVSLPFNHRLNYSSASTVKAMHSAAGPIQISWDPGSFPERIDVKGSSGFVGGASRTRIPTGVALASRISECLDLAVGVSSNAPKKLTIRIINADSSFQYSAGIFNVTPAIDQGKCVFEAEFSLDGKTWKGEFRSESKDKSVGGSSSTGTLEKVWDDIALQVCQDVVKHLGVGPNPAGAGAEDPSVKR